MGSLAGGVGRALGVLAMEADGRLLGVLPVGEGRLLGVLTVGEGRLLGVLTVGEGRLLGVLTVGEGRLPGLLTVGDGRLPLGLLTAGAGLLTAGAGLLEGCPDAVTAGLPGAVVTGDPCGSRIRST
ncbi:hypothetical protein [Actinoplanes sp. DH11]|uniref:hypothetical protein n=1 Tax=Actinoplanes sp. DH11 TaxID=2857011 RepID=UPI001E4D0C7D|nr:hypothetical protein [Actinoplanes sp. DH11]